MREPTHDAGPPDARGEALLALRVGAASSAAELRLAIGLGPGETEALVERLLASGEAEARRAGRLALTAAGQAAADAVLRAERAALGEQVVAALAAFAPLDERMKRAITAWQVRTLGSVEVPNDHGDPRHDAAVLTGLAGTIDDAVALLRPLAARRARFARAGARLVAAAQRARAGETAFVCGLDVDSAHTVWWKLHGELLALAGRTRDCA